MKDLLEQYFSREHFDLQFKFKSGNIVDAILRTDKGLIAIDAKFPLENFKRLAKAEIEEERAAARHDFVMDVRKHIQDISRKYIVPDEQTVDFAIMYIPAESIYYEIIHDDSDLHSYAHEKRVFPVSPNSFYYFLRVILLGMEGKRIEEASKKILEMLNAIQGDAKRFGDHLGVLNTHITNAKGALDRVNTEYGKLSGKIDQTKMLK
ncbi:MAG: DNA recombination protein RmuC [Candidatus Kerfeldbacteria bacterium]|nr:DNA recombination protein RmuC [Candidatus Kerfeldbacteria bacterium]